MSIKNVSVDIIFYNSLFMEDRAGLFQVSGMIKKFNIMKKSQELTCFFAGGNTRLLGLS